MGYCDFVKGLGDDTSNPHKYYHDKEYGFALSDDNDLFERLVLEINQAGLSWSTILNKRENFRKAYDNFIIETVAAYQQDKIDELLQDKGIIRNKLKVNAAIYNAQQIVLLQREFGSFKKWLDIQEFETLDQAVKLFKKHFKFVGGEIVNEFLMSTGYLPGAHSKDCPIYKEIENSNA
ncbi:MULTISPECIES: DNA-3-methyladenine glycosylase I [Myroides]|uniref:DNA-3-methyladenine glycosylase I n=1 Tax=Myroides albus TaxID=2562892 RepID=A0A6I3LPD0_9FLAO|nr:MULTISPECIES: DNA-3-methyladenine glycosylase I [Myroides]MTG98521.1 DNA-3-methyladenine glycosylase I [Myroides albus]MVX34936.1 DNA-3-methyladenine glycosylase I [Myroides sp. LoEW2-1]UVD79543.1 DNA-3-methyladenine glycosylase I [Myroides albus]